MWVCHCNAVTDARIRSAIDDGARDEDDVAAHCGAGTRCGGCRDEVRRLCTLFNGADADSCPRVLQGAGTARG
ncbi:MAG TPA: (2Fe-2S)-binding protein [Acidimicrobiia bacterium]|jgi:bacterioferritin-associated ferredoxin